jgi:hypothetical protein
MRNLIIGAAALFAVASPGIAMAQTGYVDVAYANTDVDFGGADGEADGWAAGGAAAFDAHALGFQIDGEVGSAEGDGGGDADYWNLGGHVFTRNADFLIGGAVSFGNVDSDAGDSDYWTVAAEGQMYLDRTTLDAAVSYTEADDVDLNLTALDLGATHFVTDNFSIDGGVGFANAETGGGDADIITYRIGAEYQFAAMPISVFGGYAHAEADDFDTDADTLSIGVRYNFGDSLFDRNRSGASLARGGVAGRFLGLL